MTTTRSDPASPRPLVPELRPSHSLIMVVFTLVRVPCAESSELPSLELSRESTSSMKTTHGASRRARVKTALAFFSDSPSHLFSTEEASTLRKDAPPSVATAFASMVLPVPGGPNSSTPLTASLAMPSLYRCGNLSGYVMLCLSSSLTSPSPPIMSYVTPMSWGLTQLGTRARSCLSVARARRSSLVRCEAWTPVPAPPPEDEPGEGLTPQIRERADSRELGWMNWVAPLVCTSLDCAISPLTSLQRKLTSVLSVASLDDLPMMAVVGFATPHGDS
mmetsp:Transcript_50192/g.106891  ORF Transcript_50192/g.106891 Transcript_50192/m.106891 type:complete len:276 (-) Transcript_50192:1650-2477(-)